MSGIFWSGHPERILNAWSDGKIKLIVSPEILNEYVRVGNILSKKYPGVDISPFIDLVTVYGEFVLSNDKNIKSGLEKFFSKSGKLLTEQIEQEEKFHGYSCIFTTAKLTPEQMIHHYFEKDLVEKAFQSLKGVVRLRPIRHWLYNRVIAHVFICYLSYLLLSILKLRLTKINLSPVKALQELDTLYKVYMHDSKKGFEVSRVVALNKMQEKILKTVDKKLIQVCSG